jgi:hypothetical protein
VGALLVRHRAGCRKPLRVKVVRTYPHTFPELREVQGHRGFPELEAIGCRPTIQRNDRQFVLVSVPAWGVTPHL